MVTGRGGSSFARGPPSDALAKLRWGDMKPSESRSGTDPLRRDGRVTTQRGGVGHDKGDVDWDAVFRAITHQTAEPSHQAQRFGDGLRQTSGSHDCGDNGAEISPMVSSLWDGMGLSHMPDRDEQGLRGLDVQPQSANSRYSVCEPMTPFDWQVPRSESQTPLLSAFPADQAAVERSQSFIYWAGGLLDSPSTRTGGGHASNDVRQDSRQNPINWHQLFPGRLDYPLRGQHQPHRPPLCTSPLFTSSRPDAFSHFEPSFGSTSAAPAPPDPAFPPFGGLGQLPPPQPCQPIATSAKAVQPGFLADPAVAWPGLGSGMFPPPDRAPLRQQDSSGPVHHALTSSGQSSRNPSPAQTPLSNPTSGEDSEDKRVRNTVASKFRAKKKAQVAQVTRTIDELEEQQASLQADVASLRYENGVLREMVQLKFGTKLPDDQDPPGMASRTT